MTDILEELRGKSAADLTDDQTPDELRGKTPDELVQYVEVLDAHLNDLHMTESGELRDRTPDEQRAFDYGLKLREIALNKIDHHRNVQQIFKRKPKAVERALANIKYGQDDVYADVRRLAPAELRDMALRQLDNRAATAHMSAPQKAEVERQVRRDPDIARRILVTETDAYREAWMKLVTQPDAALYLDEDERNAIRRFNEYRAMGEVTTTAGGFGIPVFIDPSIILTAQESENPFLTLARQVTINTNEWKGVSSAGVTWAFQTEAAATTDNSPVLAQPTVRVHMARGLIPYSIEVGQDYPMFAEEMARLLAAGYDELLVDKFTRGSGSGEPFGILTALSANTNVRVRIQTSGTTFGADDPYRVWKALPQKYRRRAAWLMGVDVNNKIRQIGTANVFHAFTENLKAEWLALLFNKAVYESPYMPDTTTSTSATEGYAIVGDWENYVVARRGGMSIELVPHLVDVTSNMPTGQRAWFAYARIGADSVNDLGFRLMTNT
ncbi:MAG TPA: phage major capsid protein [Jiangellaceae bacterium]|nr:phage major capsid protein [Jiangellaceae bacterium]